MKKISTSALSDFLKIDRKAFVKLLEKNLYIEIKNESLFSSKKIKVLTIKWKQNWWELKTWTKYRPYITWPEDFNPLKSKNITNIEYLSISNIAENFWMWARRMNQVISELWWIQRNTIGWKLTTFWKKIWWIQLEITKTWATYTKWPINIKENNSLLSSLWLNNEQKVEKKVEFDDYRKIYKAEKRAKDWHYVRSISEMLIDNALYDYWLTHAYERRVTNINSEVLSDFYIPATKDHEAIWIEFWWIENQEKYNNRKKIKQEIYKSNNLNLIEIENKDIENLDDFLPRELQKYWIKVE